MVATPDAPEDPHALDAHAAAAARAQAAAAARARAEAGDEPKPISSDADRAGAYAGLVTRAIAYTLDLAIINVVAVAVGIAVALAFSILDSVPSELEQALEVVSAVSYVLWLVGYFVACWSATGQTVGSRVMRIRVIDGRGAAHIRPWRALVRFGGLVLATIPLCAGFIIMLWDDRRRCLQDRIARTVVVHAPLQPRIVRQRVPRDVA